MINLRRAASAPLAPTTFLPVASTVATDVCLFVEGCYPYVPGGVSSWLDWLMRKHPHLTFALVAIVPDDRPRIPAYQPPANLILFREVALHTRKQTGLFQRLRNHRRGIDTARDAAELADALRNLMLNGGLAQLRAVMEALGPRRAGGSGAEILESRLGWDTVSAMYEATMPQSSYLHFFWAWKALCGGLLAALKAPLPEARVYHTISTGYAGLIAARAALERGRPMLVTEHGIYNNERRIEVLMAEWIADMVDKGLTLDDQRLDLRDMWMQTFDAYARCCYEAASAITTLYEDNQRLQLENGADPTRMQVIANGIDVDRFAKLPRAGADLVPTVALIGRVVPIKDVKTYIAAVANVRRTVPSLRALVLGPKDEDPTYALECERLVTELGLEATVEFRGSVSLVDWLPQIHVVALTSLSEAQPLVLLEAGAAHIPCVATDVGSCREIIEGRSDEMPRLGAGGIVTGLVDAVDIAGAITRLLTDAGLRSRQGEILHRRVATYYASEISQARYAALYEKLGATADHKLAQGA